MAAEQRQVGSHGASRGGALRYQYGVGGMGNEWSDPDPLRGVTLHLPPGSYRFEVRALTSSGVASSRSSRTSCGVRSCSSFGVGLICWNILMTLRAISGVIGEPPVCACEMASSNRVGGCAVVADRQM